LIDADPQASLSLWHRLRGKDDLVLKTVQRGVGDAIKAAKREGFEWVFVDTPPNMSAIVSEAVRAATLVVIPARPTIFDLAAVKDTVEIARELRRSYALVLNAAPPKRSDSESPIVTDVREGLARLKVPLWSGQITNRSTFSLALTSGEGAREYDGESQAAAEIAALWTAIEKSVKVINGAQDSARAMHRAAA
jgi:chromosome partitioning protein